MVVTQSDILDLFKKEKRPLLRYEIVHKLSSDPEEEFDIMPDQEFGQKSQVPIYICYKTGLNSYTKTKVPYFFHPEMLEEFWLNEILYILKKKNDEVDIETIIDELGKQVVNYYGLSDPLGESFDLTSDAGLGEEKNAALLKFLNKHNNNFYVRQGEDWILGKINLVGLVEWKDKVLENDKKIIRNEMIKVLRNSKTKVLPLKELTYRINRTKLDTLTPKPFEEELIKEIVIENLGRVLIDKNKDTITLTDDLKFISKYLKETMQAFGSFTFPKASSGLLAYTFIGAEFPLTEAKEYVKTRPIIYISIVNNRSEIIENSINKFHIIYDLALEAILPTKTNAEEWLIKNVAVSFYEENFDQIQILKPLLIEKLSPIFNVSDNPGNLFQNILKEKFEKYIEGTGGGG